MTPVTADELGRLIMEAALKAYNKGLASGKDPLEINRAIATELLNVCPLYKTAQGAP